MEQLGRFHLHRRVAVGGMAEVFLATAADGRPSPGLMVVKRLLPDMEEVPQAVESFLNEGHIGLTVRHPNIVEVLEEGTAGGRHYVVMEYVDGPDMSVMQKALARAGRPLGLARAGHVVLQVLRALDHAHFAVRQDGQPLGLVHRDVSPDNIFCRRTGNVALADFGIAKMSALHVFTDPAIGVRGKLPFMAPERVRGEPLDGRSDQFSAALVLYELCTGVRAYAPRAGETFERQRERVSRRDLARPRAVAPDMPRRLEAVIMQALETAPRHRYRTCGQFADELARVLLRENLLAGAPELASLIAQVCPA